MSDAVPTRPGAWSEREVELTLDRLAHGGAGVGRVDGRVVFVRGGLPGERVRAVVVDDRKPSFCHADAIEILEPSPHRIEPACPAAAAGAGCCDLSYVTLDHGRELKSQVLADTLTRVGRLPDVEVRVESLSEPDEGLYAGPDAGSQWRVRARLSVDGEGHPGFHRHRDAAIVTEPCIALHRQMYSTVHEHRYQPGSEVVVVRDGREQVHVVELAPAPRGDVPRRAGGQRRAQAQRHRARAERRMTHLVAGSSTASFIVGSREWRIPSTGFWQAHRRAPQVYSDAVVELVSEYRGLAGGMTLWDLYGGVGVFTAALVDAAASSGAELGQAHVVDTDATALDAATVTLGDRGVSVHRGATQAVAGTLPAPDVVVLDPPRSGAGRDVVATVAAAAPDVVVHVGCDAAAFARDLGLFVEHGYRVVEVRGFDAFPRTHHVEAIAALVRVSG
ncbi:putative RNA methyltransferase [Gordonia effusa NBRC 100432]|uniref:Putative RNA methyltransferase n=1 Tax=Gordonia effusa NBRC 100432 TaxID=1077974 RepID=H0QYL0_9ACTN|nr:TRAM domain-containing protein [Gordonia effusa]GAB17911.1 putative RNA methyltransferase [Gordonia effusa NBRC 100432]